MRDGQSVVQRLKKGANTQIQNEGRSIFQMVMCPTAPCHLIKLNWVLNEIKSDQTKLEWDQYCGQHIICQTGLSSPILCHSIKSLYLDFPPPNFDFLHQNWSKKWCGSSVCSRARIKDFCHIWLWTVFVAIFESRITLCMNRLRILRAVY